MISGIWSEISTFRFELLLYLQYSVDIKLSLPIEYVLQCTHWSYYA